jgi:hypothetical protein
LDGNVPQLYWDQLQVEKNHVPFLYQWEALLCGLMLLDTTTMPVVSLPLLESCNIHQVQLKSLNSWENYQISNQRAEQWKNSCQRYVQLPTKPEKNTILLKNQLS